MEHASVAGRLIGSRLLHQHIQICPPSLSRRHRRYIIIISRSIEDSVKQLVDRQINGLHSKLFHDLCKEIQLPGSFRLLCFQTTVLLPVSVQEGADCPVQSPILSFLRIVFKLCRDLSQLPIRQAKKRRPEHCRQRNILHRIIQNCQKIQYRLHLNGGKISCLRFGKGRDSHMSQRLHKAFRPAGDASQQNDDIPVLRPPVSSFFFIPYQTPFFRIGKLPNPHADHSGFQLLPGVICAVVIQFL